MLTLFVTLMSSFAYSGFTTYFVLQECLESRIAELEKALDTERKLVQREKVTVARLQRQLSRVSTALFCRVEGPILSTVIGSLRSSSAADCRNGSGRRVRFRFHAPRRVCLSRSLSFFLSFAFEPRSHFGVRSYSMPKSAGRTWKALR